jgi:ribonucleoside-diphosphate reductase beta chain
MSVFLESYLFYSGFYFPVYLAGQGKMTTSGEVIRKIIIDESIHGSFVGYAAQELRSLLTEEERDKADVEMYRVLESLFANEVEYTHEIYDAIGIADDVINYVKYNANRALQNLGFEPYFEHGPINPIVENGINTDTKNHDFFSQKGDGYVIALNVEPLTDDDFKFPNLSARK